MAPKATVKTIYRSSISGRIVKASVAKANPRETEKQHVYVLAPKKK